MAHGGGGLPEELAGLGEGELLALVVEQAGAVLLLQRMDVLGDGGLGDMQQLGRPGEIHGLTYGEKGFNAKIQHQNNPLRARFQGRRRAGRYCSLNYKLF